MSPIHLSHLISIHSSPSPAGGVRLSACLQFICLSVWLVLLGSPDVFNSLFGVHGSPDAFLYLIPFMCFLLPTVSPWSPSLSPSLCPSMLLSLSPSLFPSLSRVPACLSLCASQCCLFRQGPGHSNLVSYSGFPVVSHSHQLFPIVFKVSSNGTQLSPSCGDVISQLSSNCLSLVSR